MNLVRLLRRNLAAYRTFLTAVVVLQFVGVVAMLYLPSLNADIIDNGVARGDTDYILHTGGVMLAVSLAQIVCSTGAVWFGARTAMSFGRDTAQLLFEVAPRDVGQQIALEHQRARARVAAHLATDVERHRPGQPEVREEQRATGPRQRLVALATRVALDLLAVVAAFDVADAVLAGLDEVRDRHGVGLGRRRSSCRIHDHDPRFR